VSRSKQEIVPICRLDKLCSAEAFSFFLGHFTELTVKSNLHKSSSVIVKEIGGENNKFPFSFVEQVL
jgi:hypothetical protein